MFGDALGSNIAARRNFLGLTQAQLAARTGTSQQHLSLIERGLIDPTFKTLRRVFDALGWELAARVRGNQGIGKKLSGLDRFNAWEESSVPRLDWREALARAGALLKFRDLVAIAPPKPDWRERARRWIRWRESLPRKAWP